MGWTLREGHKTIGPTLNRLWNCTIWKES